MFEISTLLYRTNVCRVTVTVTKALVLCPLLEDRGRASQSQSVSWCPQTEWNVFRSWRKKSVDRSSFSSVGSRCSNRNGSVTNSSLTCPRHDEVATRWTRLANKVKCNTLLRSRLSNRHCEYTVSETVCYESVRNSKEHANLIRIYWNSVQLLTYNGHCILIEHNHVNSPPWVSAFELSNNNDKYINK